MPSFENTGDDQEVLAAGLLQRGAIGRRRDATTARSRDARHRRGVSPGPPLGRTPVVPGFELLDTERTDAAGCEIVERGASHGAQADHDDVCGARIEVRLFDVG